MVTIFTLILLIHTIHSFIATQRKTKNINFISFIAFVRLPFRLIDELKKKKKTSIECICGEKWTRSTLNETKIKRIRLTHIRELKLWCRESVIGNHCAMCTAHTQRVFFLFVVFLVPQKFHFVSSGCHISSIFFSGSFFFVGEIIIIAHPTYF